MPKSSRVKSKGKAKAPIKAKAKAPIKAKAKAPIKAKAKAKAKAPIQAKAKAKPHAKAKAASGKKRVENLPPRKRAGNAGATASSKPKASRPPNLASAPAPTVDDGWGEVETSAPQTSLPLPSPTSDGAFE